MFAADSVGLSSFNLYSGLQKRIFSTTVCLSPVQGHPRSMILVQIERTYIIRLQFSPS